jgi:anti-sigma factor RsiW
MKPPREPRLELLAAFVDHELDEATQAHVEAWLADRPEARDEVRGQREVGRLVRELGPPEPSDAAWAATLAALERRLAAGPVRNRPRWPVPLGVLAASVAAGLLLAVFALPHRAVRPTPGAVPLVALPVAGDADIEIVSMDDADRAALVVGHPPVPGVMVLAAAGDIDLEHVDADEDGRLPHHFGMTEGPSAPMIVAPLARAP